MSKRLLILLLLGVCCMAACQKSSTYGIEQYRAQAKIDDSIVSQYIRTNHLNAKHVNNNDTVGVYYIVIDSGSTPTLYTNSTRVTVGDTGRLITSGTLVGDGPLFYETNNIHPTYPLGQMILGWQLGIPQVKNGGEVRLLIPSRYAYGHFAHPELGTDLDLPQGLPANAVLDFRIRLYDVTN